MSRNKNPGTELEELKKIIESNLGEVHSIEINQFDNNVYNVKMYERVLTRHEIDTLEHEHKLKLTRINMQKAQLTFRLLEEQK